MKTIRIGTSGWSYDHWIDRFYPKDLPKSEWLEFYSKVFNSVEINTSFYHLPKPEDYEYWFNRTPEDFLFALKGNRYITHFKKLTDPYDALDKFFGSAKKLEDKTGPILFQLPPNFLLDEKRLEAFIQFLPERYLYSFEFRNDSWYKDEIYKLLELNNIALCLHDHSDGPSPEIVTADFIYLRLHGPDGAYAGSYSEEQLQAHAFKMQEWLDLGKQVFAYFNNDANANAVENAKELMALLG